MTPTLIVLALVALAVGIVVWATRKRPSRPYEERLEQDTAWNDPVTPADADPFAGAPAPADSDEAGVSETTRNPTSTDRPLV